MKWKEHIEYYLLKKLIKYSSIYIL